jgi:hypothetical protein
LLFVDKFFDKIKHLSFGPIEIVVHYDDIEFGSKTHFILGFRESFFNDFGVSVPLFRAGDAVPPRMAASRKYSTPDRRKFF